MLKASMLPEIWPSPSQNNRPCYGGYFTHPATANNPESYYDSYGYCNPYLSTSSMAPSVVQAGFPWGTILLIGAVAIGGYYLYSHRKKIFA